MSLILDAAISLRKVISSQRLAITLLVCCVLCFGSVYSQQVEEFSLLRENAFVLNPALAGTQGYVHGTATFRKQFTKVEQSPYTALLAMDGEIKEKRLGIGGYIIHDVTGPTGKTSGTVSIAYNIPLYRNKYQTMHRDKFCNR